jgi:hypothetical protein
MKPMTAMTLIIEKTNSASPYPLTPNRLIVIITTRNTVTKIAWSSWLFQKSIVIEAAMTSSGSTTNHCIA